jgi:hypothetical protein
MNDALMDLLNKSKLKNQSAKIDIKVSTADAMGTYGFSIKTECIIRTQKSYCVNCGMLKGHTDKWCLSNGLHNFRRDFFTVASGHGDTPDEAIASVLSTLQRDTSTTPL